jgi:hypothetical protein
MNSHRGRLQPSIVAAVAVAVGLSGGALAAACPAPDGGHRGPINSLRLDDVQFLASHNSYHVEPEPVLLEALRGFIGDEADTLEYTHHRLAAEFRAGVRSIELDLFNDRPEGGLYASPKLIPLLGLDPPDPRLARPGTKVFHIQEVDYRSTCTTFVSCLRQVRRWSNAHPRHVPIMIQLEAKADLIPDPGIGFVQPLPWDQAGFARVEDEIRAVFDEERIITPGDVQGDAPTLADAVRADGWPKLKHARGKVMFTLDSTGGPRATYRGLHPVVADRLVFVAARPPDADAAFVVLNDPIAEASAIRQLADQHFLIRTRADADTVQARSGDRTQKRAAWASGAHFVSTDYVFRDPRFGTNYRVRVPGGGSARCNPVTAPRRCDRIDFSR